MLSVFDLLPEDRDACLEIGRLDVGEQPPLEPRAQPLLQGRDLPRRAVGRDDDLGAALVERVEGMEELLLDALLALEELDVVDEQDVVVPVAALEPLDPLVAQGVDEVVHEGLARHVAHRQPPRVLSHVVPDRLEQVRLAEPRPAVDEQRVVGLGRRLGDRERGRVGEAVRRADDEEVEGVLRVELDLRALAERRDRFAHSRRLGGRRRTRPLRRRVLRHRERDDDVTTDGVARRVRHEAVEVALDPVPREIVRDRDLERPVAQRTRLRVAEPGVPGRLAERLAKPERDRVPETTRIQFNSRFRGVLQPVAAPGCHPKRTASIAASPRPLNEGRMGTCG